MIRIQRENYGLLKWFNGILYYKTRGDSRLVELNVTSDSHLMGFFTASSWRLLNLERLFHDDFDSVFNSNKLMPSLVFAEECREFVTPQISDVILSNYIIHVIIIPTEYYVCLSYSSSFIFFAYV